MSSIKVSRSETRIYLGLKRALPVWLRQNNAVINHPIEHLALEMGINARVTLRIRTGDIAWGTVLHALIL